MKIGDWVKRRGGKWHVVESIVAADAITKCGRRMDWATASGGPLQVSDVMPLTRMIGQPQLCKAGCDRPDVASEGHDRAFEAPGSGEDDGSTWPTEGGEDTP